MLTLGGSPEPDPARAPTPEPLSRRGVGIGAIPVGDVIKALTRFLGVEPCRKCEERAERLNRWSSRSRGTRE